MKRRGRKPFRRDMYGKLVVRLKALHIDPPSSEAYIGGRKEFLKLIDDLLDAAESSWGESALPSNFDIVGDWVSCITHSNGRRLSVWGKGLKLERGRET